MVVSGYAMKKVSGDTEVCRNDGVNGAAIYIGSLDCLEKADVLCRTVGEGINEAVCNAIEIVKGGVEE